MTRKELIEEMFVNNVECNYCRYGGACEGYPPCYELDCSDEMFNVDRYLEDIVERKF